MEVRNVQEGRVSRDSHRRSLLSTGFKDFPTYMKLRKPITAPLMQNGELKALKPHQVESSTVVQSSQLAE